jgi:tellurite resistance protein
MTDPIANPAPKAPLPVPASFFGMVLGLTGVANTWRGGHAAWGLPAGIGETLFAIAGAAWAVIAILYAWKWIAYPALAREEAGHPVQCCFIGLGGVSTLLIALGALPYSRPLAILLFAFGVAYTVAFALWRTGLLWQGQRDPAATTPVLYLPSVAGGFVSAIVAAALGWRETGQMAFGAGFFSWLAIESVLLHRFYTGPAMPPALRPTLGIQLAPPAVGAVAYLAVSGGGADLMGHMLIGYALLQALLLIRMGGWIAEQPFAASYWAFTFGATALAGAAIRIGRDAPDGPIALLAPALFVLANMLVAGVAAGTLWLAARHRLIPAQPPVPPPT